MIGQLNPTQLSSRLAAMTDQQLRQYAMLHHDDPFVMSIAVDVKNQRDAARKAATTPPPSLDPTVVNKVIANMAQLPPMGGPGGAPGGAPNMPPGSAPGGAPNMPPGAGAGGPPPMPPAQAADGGLMRGIAKLPARNIARMAGGGIASYADDGDATPPHGMFDFVQRSEPVIRVAGGGVLGYKGGGEPDAKQAFAMQYKDLAEKVGAELGVDPGLVIAQWGLESGWGEKTVGDYNFGNIKDRMGKGPRARDKAEGSYDAYREYKSPEAFAADYVDQIKRNWPGAVGAGRDPAKFAEGLRKGRLGAYATAPDYDSALIRTFSSLIPSAQAATRQAPPVTPTGQIPGAAPGQVAPAATTPQRDDRNLPWWKHLAALPETAATLATGAVSPLTGALKTGADYAFTGRSEGIDRNAREAVYTPRSEAGQQQVEGIAQIAEALKLPPYIPAVGSTVSAARAAQAARAARAAEEAAGQATSSAAKVAAPRIAPPPAAGTTPAREASLQRARLAELQRDQAAAQAAQATAGTTAQEAAAARAGIERAGANAAYGAGVAQRAGLAGLTGAGAQIAAANPMPAGEARPSAVGPARPSSDLEQARMREANEMPGGVSPAQAAKAVDVAKQAIPPERRKGWDWEDLMAFGLSMMAGQSPYAAQNIGKAGLAAIANKQAREKEEREDMYRTALSRHAEAQAKQSEALAAKYGAETDVLKTGSSKIALATKAADTAFDNYMAALKNNPLQAMKATPESMNAIRLQLLHDAYKQYGLDTSTLPSSTSGPAKANFVFNPQTGKIE